MNEAQTIKFVNDHYFKYGTIANVVFENIFL